MNNSGFQHDKGPKISTQSTSSISSSEKDLEETQFAKKPKMSILDSPVNVVDKGDCHVGKVNKLKDFLSTTNENWKIDNIKINNFKQIDAGYVPLQIDQYLANCNSGEMGHEHTRKEIIFRSKNSTSGILPKDFFQMSHQHLFCTADYQKHLTEEARAMYLNEKGNLVGVIAQAGLGKSTFIKDLLYRNLTDEQLYKADFVFYVKLQDFFDTTEINLFQFLMGKVACDSLEWIKDSDICEEVLKLLSQSESVCILLDGFDKAGIDVTFLKENPQIKFDINGQNSPKYIILGLLSGQILPKSKKIITSRPAQLLQLSDDYKPKYIVKISGIKEQDIKQICLNICGDSYTSQVLSHIESQPDLLSYCLVPFNCILIVYCIYSFFEKKFPKLLPNNITDILTYCLLSDADHTHASFSNFDLKSFCFDLRKLSSLAWNGLKNKKLNFNEDDLKAAGINDSIISSFCITIEWKKQKSQLNLLQNATKNCIYFSHLLIQEFFAAVFCLFYMDLTEFKTTFLNSNQFSLSDNHLEMVTKFLFGLTNSKRFETLKKYFLKISESIEKIVLLQEYAKNYASSMKSDGFCSEKTLAFVNVCSWGYESGNSKFCKVISDSFPETLILSDSLLPRDILSICYLLKERKKRLVLHIGNGFIKFIRNALHQLCKQMESILAASSFIQVKVINLQENSIDDETAVVLPNIITDAIEQINLNGCNVSKQGLIKIATKISELKNPPLLINLNLNNIDDETAEVVSNIIKGRIKKIELVYCHLTAQAIARIVTKITELSNPLESVNLGLNDIGDETAEVFSNIIKDGIKEIEVVGCGLTEQGAARIAAKIGELTIPVTTLKIAGNEIGDAGFIAVASCIDKIDEISIGSEQDEHLSIDGVIALCNSMQNRSFPMKYLEIDCPDEIQEEVEKELQVLRSEHKVDRIEINGYPLIED